MKRFDAVLFDKDGTLFDFHRTWGAWTHGFIHDLAGDAGAVGPVAAAMGYDLDKSAFRPDSVVIAGSVDVWADHILPHLAGWTKPRLVSHIKDRTATATQVPSTDLDPFLKGLTALGYRLGVATNDGHAPVTRQLRDAGIAHHFDFVAGYDSGYGAKPDPGMLLAFARQMNTSPDRTVMVGDSTHDLVAARRAGMTRVGVLTGIAARADLDPFADVVLSDISDLPDWLESH